jgi:hypothetical protein
VVEWVDAARVGLGLLGLGLASMTDIKTREVPNELWYALGAAALALMALDFNGAFGGAAWVLAVPVGLLFVVAVTGGEILSVFPEGEEPAEDFEPTPAQRKVLRTDMGLTALFVAAALAVFVLAGTLDLGRPVGVLEGPQAQAYSTSVMFGLSIGLYMASLLAGGGDAKALILLSCLFPRVPVLPGLPLVSPSALSLEILPYSLALFFNAGLLLVLLRVPLSLAMSAREGRVKLPQSLFGHPKRVANVDLDREWVMGRLEEGAFVETRMVTHGAHSDGEQAKALAFLKGSGVEKVFVTSKLPFMVYLLVGLAVALLVTSPLYFVAR